MPRSIDALFYAFLRDVKKGRRGYKSSSLKNEFHFYHFQSYLQDASLYLSSIAVEEFLRSQEGNLLQPVDLHSWRLRPTNSV